MNRIQERTFGIGLTLVIVSIITIAVFSFRQTMKVNIVAERIEFTRNVLLQLNDLYTTIIEHAGAVRNYSLSGKEEDVKIIRSTASSLHAKSERLKTFFQEDLDQEAQADSIIKYINKRIAFSNHLISEGQEKGLAAATALYQTGIGRDYNNLIFSFIQKMQTDELSTLHLNEKKNTDRIKLLGKYLLGILAFILILITILVQKSRADIAARKKIEQDLKNFNQHLQDQVKEKTAELTSVFERITDAFIAIDKNFRYTYVNKKAGEITNRDPASLIGKNIWEEFPGDMTQPFYQAAHKAMADQEYISIDEYYPEYGRWFENHLYPSPEGLSVFFRDISKRKKAEEAVRQSEERYRALIEQASDAIMITDNKGDFIDVNTSFCNKFGYTKEDLMGLNIAKVIDPQQMKVDPIRFDRLMAGEAIFRERRMMHKDGTIIEVEANVKMLPDGRMLAIARDITERKKAEQEKEKARYLLNERIKELTTLYKAGQILQKEEKSVESVLKEIVSILPAGWQYPDITAARIIFGNLEFSTPNFADSIYKQSAGFQITGETTCLVEVVYLEKRPEETEGPFHAEERNLINMIAEMLRVYFVRREAAELVLKEKNLSDSVINSMPGIFYLYDLTGKFIRWNKRCEIVTGYNSEEISQMHPLDFFDDVDKDYIKDRIREVFEKGVGDAEALLMTKEKNKIPYYFTGAGIEIDSTPYFLGTGIDITERKKAEEELRISEQKYKLLFENNPLPIIMFSKVDLSIIDVNQSSVRHYGYSKKEFLQMNVKDLRPKEDVHKFMEKVTETVTGDGNLGTWRHRKKDGTLIDVEVTGHEIIYNGVPARLVLCNDVTEKLKAQENLQKSYEEIRLLASNIQNIREEEKIKIAREIHDELGQQLTGLKMDVSWLSKKLNTQDIKLQEKTKEIMQLLDETVRSVRRIASELRPGLLDDLGLVAAMEWHSEEFEKRSGIKVEFKNSVKETKIPSRLSTGFFRIYQESLTNVARHAQANNIIASLEQSNGEMILKIRDDGKGFDANEIQNKKTLGLLGMKERTMMMGGKYDIVSKPGKGTTVIISVSLANGNNGTEENSK